MTMALQERIFAGKGTIKADLAIIGGKIVNVNTKEIIQGDIAARKHPSGANQL